MKKRAKYFQVLVGGENYTAAFLKKENLDYVVINMSQKDFSGSIQNTTVSHLDKNPQPNHRVVVDKQGLLILPPIEVELPFIFTMILLVDSNVPEVAQQVANVVYRTIQNT